MRQVLLANRISRCKWCERHTKQKLFAEMGGYTYTEVWRCQEDCKRLRTGVVKRVIRIFAGVEPESEKGETVDEILDRRMELYEETQVTLRLRGWRL